MDGIISKYPKNSQDEDRISSLPDALLCHLLSFLPTKQALTTSILSNRWKYLWASVPNLDFDDDHQYEDNPNFIQFVDRVLIFHNVSNIQRFRVSCTMGCTDSHINTWLSAAISRNVQELHLHTRTESYMIEPYILPHSLFSCKSLRVLHLGMNYTFLKPPPVYLPNLKILVLESVVFADDDSAERFFLGCPVIEQLTVSEYAWHRLKEVNFSFATLQSLSIHLDSGEELEYQKISISAPNLTSFMYSGIMLVEYSLRNLSSIVDAYVSASTIEGSPEEVSSRACKLLTGLSGVQKLNLSNGTIKTLSYAGDLLVHLPTFSKLTYLEVSGNFMCCNFGTLLILLQGFPKLEYLVFSEEFYWSMYSVDDWMSKPVPQCLSSAMKEVKFGSFCGTLHELCLVSFLLKNATVLKSMTIICSENLLAYPKKQVAIKEQVLKVPRSSTSCAIMYS